MTPLVSIIIPVGPRHAQHCRVAAASALRQTVARFGVETIVVGDGDAEIAPMAGVTLLPASGAVLGPAATRNRGIAVAQGLFALFLDADDYLLPQSVEYLLRAYAEGGAGYVYGDAYLPSDDGLSARRAPDYDQLAVSHHNLHVVTALAPLAAVRAVGGFDDEVDAWEDWSLWLRLARAGVCGRRTPYPVFVYRVMEGQRMTAFLQPWQESRRQIVERCGQIHDITVSTDPRMEAVRARFTDSDGRIRMACCGGSDPYAEAAARQAVGRLAAPQSVGDDGLVLVEYAGEAMSKTPYKPPWETSVIYLGGNPSNRYARVQPRTAQWLVELGAARVRHNPPAPEPPPAPLPEQPDAVVAAGTDAESEAPEPRPRGRRTTKSEAA